MDVLGGTGEIEEVGLADDRAVAIHEDLVVVNVDSTGIDGWEGTAVDFAGSGGLRGDAHTTTDAPEMGYTHQLSIHGRVQSSNMNNR